MGSATDKQYYSYMPTRVFSAEEVPRHRCRIWIGLLVLYRLCIVVILAFAALTEELFGSEVLSSLQRYRLK